MLDYGKLRGALFDFGHRDSHLALERLGQRFSSDTEPEHRSVLLKDRRDILSRLSERRLISLQAACSSCFELLRYRLSGILTENGYELLEEWRAAKGILLLLLS